MGSRHSTRAPTPSRSSSSCSRWSPAVPGHTVWVGRESHRRRSSSAPWSSSPTSYPWCRFWTFLGGRGGSGGGDAAEVRRAVCRAGYRSAHDLFWTGSLSVLPFAVRRRQNCWWKCRRSQDIHSRLLPRKPWGRGQQRHWLSRSLTFQFLRFGGEVAEVFKVPEQDRVQQQRTWSRLLKFQLAIEVSRFSPRPQLPHRVGCLTTQMKENKGVFRTFPRPKKSAEVTRQSSPIVLGSVSSSELSSHQMDPGGESDESGEDEAGDALSAACAALRRLRRRRGGGGAVQKSVGISVMDVPVLFSDKFLQSKEFDQIVPQIQFIFRVWDIPVVQWRRVHTVQPVLKTGDSTVLVQFWGAVDMLVVVQRKAPGCSQSKQP